LKASKLELECEKMRARIARRKIAARIKVKARPIITRQAELSPLAIATPVALDYSEPLGTGLYGLTAHEAQEIFNSSSGPLRGDGENYDRIAHYVSRGAVSARFFRCNQGHSVQDSRELREKASRCGGEHHGALKYGAMLWLRSLGATNPLFEQPLGIGRCDVASGELGIYVECGDCDPAKVWTALLMPNGLALALFPYGMPGGVYFTRGELFDMVVADQSEREARLEALLGARISP
jgi:hypothetical protein